MAAITEKIGISYYWSIGKHKLTEQGENDLKNQTKEHIFEMILSGYTSGELCGVINHDGRETEFRGWWECTKE